MKTKHYKCGGKVRKYATGTSGASSSGSSSNNTQESKGISMGMISTALSVGDKVGSTLETKDASGVNTQGSVNSGIASMLSPTKIVTNTVDNVSKGISNLGKGNFAKAGENLLRTTPFIGGYLGNEDAKREAAKQRRKDESYKMASDIRNNMQNTTVDYQSTFAKGGVQKGKVNAEVEKQEVLRYPDGKIQAIPANAPSHAEGGVKMNLPNGTQILGKNKIPGTDVMFKEVGQKLAKVNKALDNINKNQPTAIARKTAELNQQNVQKQFDTLMLAQESMKQTNNNQKFAEGGAKQTPVGTGTVRKQGDWYDIHSDLRGQFLKQLTPEGQKDAMELEKLPSNAPQREELSRAFVKKHGDKFATEAAVDSTAKVYGSTAKDFYAGNQYHGKKNVGMPGVKEQAKQPVVKFGIRQLSTDYAKPNVKKQEGYSAVLINNVRDGYTREIPNDFHNIYGSNDERLAKKPIVTKSSYKDMSNLISEIQQKGDTTINGTMLHYDKTTNKIYKANGTNPNKDVLVTTKNTDLKNNTTYTNKRYATNGDEKFAKGGIVKYGDGAVVNTAPMKFKAPTVNDEEQPSPEFTNYANTLYGDNNLFANKNKHLLAFDNDATFENIKPNTAQQSGSNKYKDLYSNNKSKIGDTAMNLATLLPVGYNIMKGLGKAEKIDPRELYNPNDANVNALLDKRSYNIQPELNTNRATQRIIERNLRNSGLSQAGLVGGYIGSANNRAASDAKAYADKQNIENQYTMQKADMLNQQGRDKASVNATVKQLNSQSKANKNNMLGAGLSQLSQFAQNKQLMKNQKGSDMSKVALLKDMFPNYDFKLDSDGNPISINPRGKK